MSFGGVSAKSWGCGGGGWGGCGWGQVVVTAVATIRLKQKEAIDRSGDGGGDGGETARVSTREAG